MSTIIKQLKISPGKRLYVTSDNKFVCEGLAPDNTDEIIEFLMEQYTIEDDKFTMLCRVYDKFGKKAMAFAYAVICGVAMIEMLMENTDDPDDDGTDDIKTIPYEPIEGYT